MTRFAVLRHALRTFSESYRERAERGPARGLTAVCGLDTAATPASIKNISASGVSLLTREPGHSGDVIALVLRKQSEPDKSEDLQISLQARVIRLTEDGVALAFAPPQGMDAKLFEVLLRNITNVTDPDLCAEMFLTFRTVLFLYRLCGAGAEEVVLLLDGQLDTHRTSNLFKIVLTVENILTLYRDADQMHAHSKVVANILRHGTWADDELTVRLWTGLFVSSCSMGAPDDSNQVLVDLLAQLTPTQARILIHAYERFLGPMLDIQDSTAESIVLDAKEMIQLTGVHDQTRNATDLAYLFNLGLIEKVFDFTSYRESDTFDITPTGLGLELYKHCHGSREKLEINLAESAREHLAGLLPAPMPSAFAPQTSRWFSVHADRQ
jgi:PilZ domain